LNRPVIGHTQSGKPVYPIAGGAVSDNQITVEVQFSADLGNLEHALRTANAQLNQLSMTNARVMQTTGKLLPTLSDQILVLKALASEGDKTAKTLIDVAHSQGAFYTAFSGNVKQNLAALFRSRTSYKEFTKQLQADFARTAVISNQAGQALTTVADDIALRYRLMGQVMVENIDRAATKMITLGKQAQWVGRQLIVGVTAPVTAAFYMLSREALQLSRAETELVKFMMGTGESASEVAARIKKELIPQLQQVSVELGVAQEETVNLAASWVAAGFDNEALLVQITKLTEQLAALTQGDLELADAQELVRSIMATFFDQTEEGVRQTEEALHQLQLIQSITSLQMADMAKALPLVSSVAKTLSLSVSEIAAMLAGMRQLGVQAPVAANALKFGLARLVEPTEEAKASWEALTGTDLGKILFEGGEPRGLAALRDIFNILSKLNSEQRTQMAALLFGARQYDRFLKLIQAMKDPTSDFAKAMLAVQDQTKADSFWQEQLNAVLDSAVKKWERFKVQIQVFAARLGEIVLPQMEKVIKGFLRMLEVIDKLPDSVKRLAVTIASLAAAMGPLIYSMAFIKQIIPGNIIKIPAFIGRKIFGVRGVEAPEATVPGIAGLVLEGVPLLGQPITAAELTIAKEMQVREIAKKLASAVPGANISRKIFELPTSTLVAAAGGKALTKEELRPLAYTLFRETESGKKVMLSYNKIKEALGITIAEATSSGIASGATAAATTKKGFFNSIRSVFSTATAAGMEDATKNRTFIGRFFANMQSGFRGLFGSFETNVVAGTGAQGAGRFAKILLQFTSALPKIILLVTVAIGVMAHWRQIWEGLAPSITKVIKILSGTFTRIAETITRAIKGAGDGAKSTKEIWVEFGQVVGMMLEGIAKRIDELSKAFGPLIGWFVRIGKVAFEAIAPIFNLLSGDFKGFITGITRAGKGIDAITRSIGYMVAILTVAYTAWRVYNSQLVQATLGTFGLTEATVSLGTALKGLNFSGWLAMFSLVAAGIELIINLFHKNDQTAQELAKSLSELTDEFADFINKAKQLTSEDDLSQFAELAAQQFDTLKKKIGDLAVEFGKLRPVPPLMDRVIAATNVLIPLMADLNELTADQLKITQDVFAQKLKEVGLERRMTAEIINELKLRRAALIAQRDEIVKNAQASIYDDESRSKFTGEVLKKQLSFIDSQLDQIDKLLEEQNIKLQRLNILLPVFTRLNKTAFESAWADKFNESISSTYSLLDKAKFAIEGMGGAADKTKKSMEDLKDTLANQLGDVIDRFVSAVLESFDRQTESMVDAMQARIDKVSEFYDKQIEKINELNDKEDWLQQQREYRQRREELLRQMELNSAIAALERRKAIAMGQFDEAKLISLRAQADREASERQLKELDEQHKRDVIRRQRELRIKELQAEKERKVALLEAQQEQLQKMRDAQRTVLQNMLDDLTEFGARNKKEWMNLRDEILKLVDNYGINLNEINKTHMEVFGRNLAQELRDAFHDAQIEASRSAEQTGKTIGNSLAEGVSQSEALKKVDEMFQKVKEYEQRIRMLKAKGILDEATATQLWNKTLAGIKKDIYELTHQTFHTGGFVGGRGEVPAILESGEYVLRKEAVQAIGKARLDQINDNEPRRYHFGGLVRASSAYLTSGIGQMMSLFGFSAGQRIGTGLGVYLIKALVENIAARAGEAVKNVAVQTFKGRGPFRTFPIAGTRNYSYSDTFGAPRPGGRTHQGIDIIAPMGTPVVATFPGFIERVPNELGGLAVHVRGSRGYTYNAHFSKYGKSGRVGTGDVIGYVGQTGNAKYSVPHLHFEWHPNNGPAVDPYQYLRAVDPKLNPKMHTGGIVRFNTPAMLHSGETVIPASVTKALSRAGSQPPVVNVNVTIEGDIYGDENSYRRLYETLERVGNKVARQRGVDNVYLTIG
jgi:TP901 family phage tail tape measure protein